MDLAAVGSWIPPLNTLTKGRGMAGGTPVSAVAQHGMFLPKPQARQKATDRGNVTQVPSVAACDDPSIHSSNWLCDAKQAPCNSCCK